MKNKATFTKGLIGTRAGGRDGGQAEDLSDCVTHPFQVFSLLHDHYHHLLEEEEEWV